MDASLLGKACTLNQLTLEHVVQAIWDSKEGPVPRWRTPARARRQRGRTSSSESLCRGY